MSLSVYDLVPKDLKGNLEYRKKVLIACHEDKKMQKAVMEACRHDMLYFINVFCWLYEPRSSELTGGTHVIPFMTYDFQDDAFFKMQRAYGMKDIGIEKSRDLGATWMSITFFFYYWLCHDFQSLGLMSRKGDLVDKYGNKDCLFWKLDFLLNGEAGYGGLPGWMKPDYKRNIMLLENLDNGSAIEGAETTAHAFRGGRKECIALDEFAAFDDGDDYEVQNATMHAASTRLFVSTPHGAAGSYYDIMHNDKADMVKIRMSWKDHPTRKLGMYTSKMDKATRRYTLEILDKEYDFPPDYPYILDGRVRSPYYDKQWNRPGATPRGISQELDMDYAGSDAQAFGRDTFDAAAETVLPPRYCGHFGADPEDLTPFFELADDAQMKCWCMHDHMHNPAKREYVVGCDISAGTAGSYSSNSVAWVIDRVTREQVAEFAANDIPPDDFADISIAICKWFNNAKINWEINGPGASFSKQLFKRGYNKIYYRDVEQLNFKKKQQKPGWMSNPQNKLAALMDLSNAIKTGELKVRSKEFVDELRQFIYKNSQIIHTKQNTTDDEAEKGAAHGDRVIAAAVAWIAVKDMPKVETQQVPQEIPYGSMAWRMKQWEDEARKLKDPWTS